MSGSPVGYLATSPPDQQSGNNPFTQSGGLLYQGLGGTPSAYLWTSAQGSPRTDHLYLTEGTIPGDYTAEGITGYLRQVGGTGIVPLTRYLNAGTGSHYYSTTGDAPSGYTTEATLGYLESSAAPDLVPLARHYNASTGDYFLDTTTTPPSGYTYQATLGYLHPTDTGTGGTITFTYDTGTNGRGRRASTADLVGSEAYGYDALGRVTSLTRITDGVAYTTGTTYTPFGPLQTLTYPDGETLTYQYNAGGQVTSVTGSTGGTYASGITYDAAGQVLQITHGNGAGRTHTYQPTTLRLASLVTTKDGTTLQSFGYGYDNVGNITTLTDNRTPANSQTFGYDDRDRLLTATGPYGSHSYTYSSIGNLLTKVGVSYTYGATAQTCGRLMPHAVTSTSDGKTYSYDCNGNLTADGERTLTWDADNKPVSITRTGVGTTTFAYSGDGARVKKQGGSQIIRYVGAYEDHVTDGVQVKHIVVGALRIATRVVGGSNAGTYFTHGDHLGSLNVLTNSTGTEVQRLTYLPFGETHTNAGSVDFDRHRFTGQEEDPETGLYFYQARYYNPVLGRFISPDSLVPEPGNPQSLNRYSYVLNNPVTLVDPSGQQFEDFDLPFSAANFLPSLFSGSPIISMDPVSASQIFLETGVLPPATDTGITTGVGDLNLWTRSVGLLRAGAGIAELAGAGALASGTSGLALPLALVLGGSGTLDLEVGMRQFWTGQPESSALSLGLQSLGISPEVAEFVDVTRSMAGTMGAGAGARAGSGVATGALGGPSGASTSNLTRAEVREIISAWDKGTFRSVADSIRYHYGRHGTGQGVLEYTRDAQRFFELNQDLAKSHLLRTGEMGLKISTETYYGIFTKEGKVISYGLR